MSNRALKWAWGQDVPSHVKFVLIALADFANEDGWAFPGQETLARMVGVSARSVRSAIRQLEALGLVVTTVRPGAGEGRHPNGYNLAIGATGSGLPNGQPEVQRRATGSLRGGNRKPASAEPSAEPSVEPEETEERRAAARRHPRLRFSDIAAKLARDVVEAVNVDAFEEFAAYMATDHAPLDDGGLIGLANKLTEMGGPLFQQEAVDRAIERDATWPLRDLVNLRGDPDLQRERREWLTRHRRPRERSETPAPTDGIGVRGAGSQAP